MGLSELTTATALKTANGLYLILKKNGSNRPLIILFPYNRNEGKFGMRDKMMLWRMNQTKLPRTTSTMPVELIDINETNLDHGHEW